MRALRLLPNRLLATMVAAGVLSGCGKDTVPTKVNGGGPHYPVLSSPQNVLLALELAYEIRDSVETKALYDSSYVGTSEDLNDPPGTIPFSFTYADEVGHVAALARTSTISSVTFDLGPSASWFRLGSSDLSHPDWAAIQIAGTSLYIQVTDGPDTYHVGGANEFFEFLFQPSTPESSSPTDTLWRIVRWRETRTGP